MTAPEKLRGLIEELRQGCAPNCRRDSTCEAAAALEVLLQPVSEAEIRAVNIRRPLRTSTTEQLEAARAALIEEMMRDE